MIQLLTITLLAICSVCTPIAKWEDGGGWEYNPDNTVEIDVYDSDEGEPERVYWKSSFPICKTVVKAGNETFTREFDPVVYAATEYSGNEHAISYVEWYGCYDSTSVKLVEATADQDDGTEWPEVAMIAITLLFVLAYVYIAMK